MTERIYYHASPVPDLTILEPRDAGAGPRLYFSAARENTLVYLSNPVERFCRETGFPWKGPFQKWATYGFDCAGLPVLEEYYPGYFQETFGGVPGYIYSAVKVPDPRPMREIPRGYWTDGRVAVEQIEAVPDALAAMEEAARRGLMRLKSYDAHPPRVRRWIEETVRREYEAGGGHPEYRAFLRAKFPFL